MADAGVGTGNVNKKPGTLTGNINSKKGSPSLSKNQQKIQSQTVGNTLSRNTAEKISPKVSLTGNTKGKSYLNISKNIKGSKNVNDVFPRYLPDGSTVIDFAYLPGKSGIESPRRLSTKEMSFLTKEYDVEFAQVYKYGNETNGGGGKYFIYSDDIKSVKVPLEKDIMRINHTHPKGTAYPSTADKNVLKILKLQGSPQKISEIIPIGKEKTVKYGMDGIK